jgi:hypothetical protein
MEKTEQGQAAAGFRGLGQSTAIRGAVADTERKGAQADPEASWRCYLLAAATGT